MLLNRVLPSRRTLRNALLIALALTLLLTAAAIAGNMHFNSGGGSWSSPFHFQAVVVGVGSDAAWVDLTLHGSILAICENQGGKDAPGQYYVDVSIAHGPVYETVDDNGRAEFDFFVPNPVYEPGSISAEEAGCPNGNWSVIDYVPDTQIWDTAVANARAEVDGAIFDTLELVCTATVNPDFTTSGTCEVPSS